MKKLSLFITCLVYALQTSGQAPVNRYPKTDEVTVFISGAEVQFSETVNLRKGDNIIHFKGLSPSLVQNSVQVSVGNNAQVLAVYTNSESILPEQVNGKLKTLKDSITLLEDQITLINNQIDAYDVEKKMLAQNQHIGGAQTGVVLTDLTKAADFFRERTLKINNAITALNQNAKTISIMLEQKRQAFTVEIQKTNLLRYNISLTVNAKADQATEFKVRYLVSDAGWQASYDIVAEEINKPVTLKYKAQIYNNTSIDWRNVQLKLSTGDISLNASRPYLTAWILNYSSGANEGYLNMMSQNVRNVADEIEAAPPSEEIAVSELNTTFNVDQKHNILANGQPYRIELYNEKLDAAFEYITIPKLELSAFLLAKVTGWQKLNLIDGQANVYFGNTFIGESNINTRLIGDTLELSLGRDNQIVVSRTKVEDKASTSAIGGKRSESFVYEIQLRNNRKVPVSVKVQDQLPVSQEKDITVDAEETSNAVIDQASGRLQWMKNVSPGETVKYKIAFTIRYPKNKTVNIRKSRMVRTPRYKQ